MNALTTLCLGMLLALCCAGQGHDGIGNNRPAAMEGPSCADAGQSDGSKGRTPEIRPPFRKLWQFNTKGQIERFIIADAAVCFGAMDSYGAVDLATGKSLWVRDVPDSCFSSDVAYDGTVLFVGVGKGKLVACEPRTGRVLWDVPMTSYAYPMTVHNNVLLCQLDEGELTALGTARLGSRPSTAAWTDWVGTFTFGDSANAGL